MSNFVFNAKNSNINERKQQQKRCKIYLLDIYLIPLPRGRHATTQRKERRRKKRRKNESEPRAKSSTPTQAIDTWCSHGGRRKEQKTVGRTKETGSGPQPNYLDHLVAFYDPHESHGGPILKPPPFFYQLKTNKFHIPIKWHRFH